MAVTRPGKEGSVTTYQAKVAAGFPDILASEMDADLDTIYAAWNGGVATANLVDGSVTTPKLATAPNGVGTTNLNDLAVTTPKLAVAPNGVGTTNLNDLSVTTPKLARGASLYAQPAIARGAGPFTLTATAQVLVELTPTYDQTRPLLILGFLRLQVTKNTTNTFGGAATISLMTGGSAVSDGTLVTQAGGSFVLPTTAEQVTTCIPIMGTVIPGSSGPLRIKVIGSQNNVTDFTMTVTTVEMFCPWQHA